jgi:hypothetical protein
MPKGYLREAAQAACGKRAAQTPNLRQTLRSLVHNNNSSYQQPSPIAISTHHHNIPLSQQLQLLKMTYERYFFTW